MTTTEQIKNTLARMPRGHIFTYTDFLDKAEKKEAIIKALNRMAASGKISKLSKGKFYKPEKTAFGVLQPEQSQVVKDLLEEKGKITGYLTGFSIYNKLGLTSQISNTIQIGKNEIRPKFTRGRYNISFIKQKNTITKENIPLLQILDSIRFIKLIPDSTNESAIKRFISVLGKIPEEKIKTLVKLARKYPPSTRALLGAMLEECGKDKSIELLRKTLNPITSYKLHGSENVLSKRERWNIK